MSNLKPNCFRITDVFSNKQRKQLIRDSKRHLTLLPNGRLGTDDLGLHEDFKSSCSHLINTFEKIIGEKLFLMNSWVVYSQGEKFNYHTHPYDFACVYYMKTNPLLQNNGTRFKLPNGKTQLIKTPQNGALLFPGTIHHATPSYFLPMSRYTLSMDINYSSRMQ